MSNKKKNTINIEWPTNRHFTIDDIQNLYPDAVNITLRFRVNKAAETKQIVAIGKIKPAIGRPKMVFASANPSKEVLDAAKAAITVAEVKSEKKTKAAPAPVSAVNVAAS